MDVIDIACGGCGAALTPSDTKCKYCGKTIVISNFNSVMNMSLPELKSAAAAYQNGNCAIAITEKSQVGNTPTEGSINFAAASCYLRLKLYDKAIEKFEAAIEDNFDNSETYFYAAISLLKGKKAFLTPMADIKKAMEYIEAALMIENRGIYNYFMAYLKYDFFTRKFLKISPAYSEELENAKNNGVSQFDVQQLFEILNVEKPEKLNIC